MNSKIYKAPCKDVKIDSPKPSGNMLHRKLESWCESEQSVLMWEVCYYEGPTRAFVFDGVEKESSGSWTIEFQFVRSNGTMEGRLFNGVSIISGSIKLSFDMINDQSTEVYLLRLNSRTHRGEESYHSAIDLWNKLTSLGQNKTS